MKLKPIEEQVVCVVGATSGIGRLTAMRFAERGAKVVAAGREQKALETLASEVRYKGGEMIAVEADVAEAEKKLNELKESLKETVANR